MGRRFEKVKFVSGSYFQFEGPREVSFSNFLTFLLIFLQLFEYVGSVSGRNSGRNLYFVEGVQTDVHFLHEGNQDGEFCLRRDVADFQVHHILAQWVNCSQHCLLSFFFGLLKLFLRLFFLLHYSFNFDLSELSLEFVDG